MAQLWLRQAKLTLGVPGLIGILIQNLRIAFVIKKTSESVANKSKISIYNLGPENSALLDNSGGRDLIATLEVGYKDTGFTRIFQGDITKSTYGRKGSDWVTTIEVGDGDKVTQTARLDKSYSAKVDLKTVIEDAANVLKNTGRVIIDNIKNLVPDPLNTGFTASGMIKDILDELMPRQNKEWFLEGNKLIIVAPDGATEEEAVVISPKTGLIGTPVRRESGIEFKSLIQPGIYAKRRVKLESSTVNGFYSVQDAVFNGDTHGKNWLVKATAIPL